MANPPPRADDVRVDRSGAPAVQCLGCEYEWRTRVMAEGLRLLGSCPKCGGELAFADEPPPRQQHDAPIVDIRAPHLVLGVPRR